MSSRIEALRPTAKARVYDLAREAGFSTDDWDRSAKRGHPAANPKYCYEWAFVEAGKVVVLNLWHTGLKELGEDIIYPGNLRADASDPYAAGAKPMWAKRAKAFDRALDIAHREGLGVRVIINDGTQRIRGGEDLTASRVKRRFLDSEPWSIASYDTTDGAFVLRRGVAVLVFDQFSAPTRDIPLPERVPTQGMAFKRDGDVRKKALERSNGRCEHCGAPGFSMANGGRYLETHHIVPLSENGLDHSSNVIALCPGHHREAHYGVNRDQMREAFLTVLRAG